MHEGSFSCILAGLRDSAMCRSTVLLVRALLVRRSPGQPWRLGRDRPPLGLAAPGRRLLASLPPRLLAPHAPRSHLGVLRSLGLGDPHYGSWDYAAGYGWVWYPGRVYAPARVHWYYGPSYVGWCLSGYYGRRHSGFGLHFGIYDWAGGAWSHFTRWTFTASIHFGHGHRRHHYGHGHIRYYDHHYHYNRGHHYDHERRGHRYYSGRELADHRIPSAGSSPPPPCPARRLPRPSPRSSASSASCGRPTARPLPTSTTSWHASRSPARP